MTNHKAKAPIMKKPRFNARFLHKMLVSRTENSDTLKREPSESVSNKLPRANPMGSSQSVRGTIQQKSTGLFPVLFAGEPYPT